MDGSNTLTNLTSQLSQSHKAQLVLAATAGCVVTASAFLGYNSFERKRRIQELREEVRRRASSIGEQTDISEKSVRFSVDSTSKRTDLGRTQFEDSYDFPRIVDPSASAAVNLVERVEPVKARVQRGEAPEELFREQLARCYALFKEEGMERIRKSKVVVVGCGGVGSWAAIMLVRSGITNIRLVDFDRVTMSSLNRHATATLGDVGLSKVQAMKQALERISLKVEVDAREELWTKEDGGKLLDDMDFVIDAIDNITTKIDLLKYCHAHKLKVISSMGAGSKLDPTRIQISDISCTAEDSLSRAVRVQLRKAGIASGIPVVYSTEQPVEDIKLLPLPEEEREKGNVQELTPFDDFRVRILPVFGPLPSIFGLNAAAYVLCEISGRPIANPLWIKGRKKTYEKLLRELLVREEKVAGETINRLPIDENDVSYIYEDLYRGRSIVPPYRVPNKAALIRWNPKEPLSVTNCVVFDAPELKKHVDGCAKGLGPEEVWGPETTEYVNKRRKEAEMWWEKAMR